MGKEGVEPEASVAHRLTLELAPRLSEIGRLTGALEAFAAGLGFSSEVIYQINLVLDELLTNTISYGVSAESGTPIGIDLTYTAPLLKIELSDGGVPFDPRIVPTPDTGQSLEERKIGGLGVHFARTFMDSMDYQRRDGRNHLTLIKRISGDKA